MINTHQYRENDQTPTTGLISNEALHLLIYWLLYIVKWKIFSYIDEETKFSRCSCRLRVIRRRMPLVEQEQLTIQ